jgi:uncharacterized protein YbjQ (UPF0145 family)
MKAFAFKPSNEPIGKFNITSLDEIHAAFDAFRKIHTLSENDYIECKGTVWTVINEGDGLKLAEGRIFKPQEPAVEVNLPIVTTGSIPNTTLVSTLGLACGEAIMGTSFLSDIAASVTDFVGGRSGSYEAKLKEGRLAAVQQMMNEAHGLGANAVIGVKVDYETVGNAMMMVVCTGTAAIVEPNK